MAKTQGSKMALNQKTIKRYGIGTKMIRFDNTLRMKEPR